MPTDGIGQGSNYTTCRSLSMYSLSSRAKMLRSKRRHQQCRSRYHCDLVILSCAHGNLREILPFGSVLIVAQCLSMSRSTEGYIIGIARCHFFLRMKKSTDVGGVSRPWSTHDYSVKHGGPTGCTSGIFSPVTKISQFTQFLVWHLSVIFATRHSRQQQKLSEWLHFKIWHSVRTFI